MPIFYPRPSVSWFRTQRGRLTLTGGGMWALGLTLALALAVLWWMQQRPTPVSASASASGNPAKGPRGGGGPQPVSVDVVQQQDVRVLVRAIGTMQTRATAVVRTKVSGELQALYFQEGQEVKAGQLLAQIDPRSYRATLDQARGNLQRSQAMLHNAQLDWQRYQDLWAQDSITRQQLDTQAALVRQYEGTVAADQAQVDAAQLQWSHTRITAPIAGRLGLRQADRGNTLNPNDANGLVSITQVQPIDVVFAVPETHLPAIRQRQHSGVSLPVELWDRDNQHLLARGHLSALDNAVDTGSGTIKAKAAFANTQGALFPNQFVNVTLHIDTHTNALTVPTAALQNNSVLYVVQENATVAQRRVRVSAIEGERAAVIGDVAAGQRVVTDGIDRLRDGAKVKVIAPNTPSAVSTPSTASTP